MAIEMQKIVAWAIGILIFLVLMGFISMQLTSDGGGIMSAFFDGLSGLKP